MRIRRGPRRRVVVVGMGDTGVLVAGLLARHHDVVGVTTAPLFVSGQELGARLARPSTWRRDYLQDYAAYRRLAGVEVVHGAVRTVDGETRRVVVDLADGGERHLDGDALVIATGTTNGFWRTAEVRTREDVEERLAAQAATVAAARSVLVVGGGPSGVSVASQVADAHPNVAVALHHSGDKPLPGYHGRTRDAVVRHLRRQGVELRAGHRAVVPSGAAASLGADTVHWATGQPSSAADVVVWAVGDVRPNTGFLPASMLDDGGFVRVDPSLQVVGHDGVFAVGDVAATDPLRSSARNFGHRVAAANVRAGLAGRTPPRRFRAPGRRWGSILGLQRDGIRIFGPRGGDVRLPVAFARHVLYPLLTHRLLYGGVRRRPSATSDGSPARR